MNALPVHWQSAFLDEFAAFVPHPRPTNGVSDDVAVMSALGPKRTC
jgi:hypothetical protein